MGTFDAIKFKSESNSVDIIGLVTGPEIEKKLKYTGDVCSGIILGKQLVNAPANVLTPGWFVVSDCPIDLCCLLRFELCVYSSFSSYDFSISRSPNLCSVSY